MKNLRQLLDERRDIQTKIDAFGDRTLMASEERSRSRLIEARSSLAGDIEQAVASTPLDRRTLEVIQANFGARNNKVDELRSVDEAAAGRSFNADETARVTSLRSEIEEIDGRLASQLDQEVRSQEINGAPLLKDLYGPVETVETRDDDGLRLEQRMTDWAAENGQIRPDERDMSLQKWLKGAVTGDWTGGDIERRAMSEGVLAGGGYMVPTPLSTAIIDRARNMARVLQAGAVTVPMTSQTLRLARVAGDPTASWHTENAAVGTSDMTLESVTLTAHTLTSLVTASRELIEDAPNVNVALTEAFAQQLALSLDLAALYGSGTAPEPRGVKNSTGVTLTANGANGTALGTLGYDVLADAIGTLRDLNEEPTGIIDSPRTERGLAKLKDTTGQPIEPSEYVSLIPRYSTNQVPVNLTVGTSADTSDIFVADWSKLYIGIRHNFTIEVLKERFADNFQLGFLAHLRADVQVARPKAFVVSSGVRP